MKNPKFRRKEKTADLTAWECHVYPHKKRGQMCGKINPPRTRYCLECGAAFWSSAEDYRRNTWAGEKVEVFEPITDVVQRYTQALEDTREALEMIAESRARTGVEIDFTERFCYFEKAVEVAEINAKKQAWRKIMDLTRILEIMSLKEAKEMESRLFDRPHELPELTLENVQATLRDWWAQMPNFLQNTLDELFRFLTPSRRYNEHKSNNGFSIGKRVVLTHMLQDWGNSWYVDHHKKASLVSMDNVFHWYDGGGFAQQKPSALMPLLEEGLREFATREVESRYFRVRWFQNGNMHVFPDQEIAKRINKDMLAGTLPDVSPFGE